MKDWVLLFITTINIRLLQLLGMEKRSSINEAKIGALWVEEWVCSH